MLGKVCGQAGRVVLREGLGSGWVCCAEGRFVVRLGVLC